MKLIDKVTNTIASPPCETQTKNLRGLPSLSPPKKKNITSAKHLSSGHGQARFSMPLGTSIWYHRHPPWSWSTSERGMSLLKSLEDSVALKAIIESPLSHSLHLSYLRLLDERPPMQPPMKPGDFNQGSSWVFAYVFALLPGCKYCNPASFCRLQSFFQSNLDKVQVWSTPKPLGKAKVHGNGVQVGKDPPTNAPW